MKYHIKSNKEKLTYRNSIFSKVISLLFFVFFLWGTLDALFRGENLSSLIVPIVLIFIALIGILYIDRWEIDKEERSINYKFGVYPFLMSKEYEVSELKKIELTHFVKGSFDENAEYKRKGRAYRAQVRFSIILKNDERVDVEVIDEKKSGGTCEQAALLFSSALGIPFTKDRDRDLDIDVTIRDIHKFRP